MVLCEIRASRFFSCKILRIMLIPCLLSLCVAVDVVSASLPILQVIPANSTVPSGQSFNVNITITAVTNLTGWEFKLYYKRILNCTGVFQGPFLSGGFFYKNVTNSFNTTFGRILAACALFGNVSVSGSGVLAIVQFKAIGGGSTPLHLADTKLPDEKNPPQPIQHVDVDGTVTVTGVNDVAVTNIHNMKTGCIPLPTVCKGMICEVYVTVKDKGDFSVTFNVTAYANSIQIGKQTVALNSGQSSTLTFNWDTTSFVEYQNYTLSATASQVPGETNLSDNTLADGKVMVSHMGDVTGDGKVDIQDVARVSGAFASLRVNDPSNPKYGQYWHPTPEPYCPHQPNTDVNGDRKVDIQDLSRTSGNFAWHRP